MSKIVYDEERNKKEDAHEKKRKVILISALSAIVIAIVGGLGYKAYYDNTHKKEHVAKESVVDERHDIEYAKGDSAAAESSEESKKDLSVEESQRVVLSFIEKNNMFDNEKDLDYMLGAIKKAYSNEDFYSVAMSKMSDEQKERVPEYTQIMNYIEAVNIFMKHSNYDSDDISEHIGGIVKQAYSNHDVGEALFNTASKDDYTYTPNSYIYYAAPFLLRCAVSDTPPDPSTMLSEMSRMTYNEFKNKVHLDTDINTLPGAKAIEFIMTKTVDESWRNSLLPTVPIKTNIYKYGDGTTSSYVLPVNSSSGMIVGVFDSNNNLIDIKEY